MFKRFIARLAIVIVAVGVLWSLMPPVGAAVAVFGIFWIFMGLLR